ncbi:MAG: DUF2490 domain-containing protein [Chitinophagaceae bacterium]|nr:DUF2490 domain-containing protein [Chitinophagaceae bacterium]
MLIFSKTSVAQKNDLGNWFIYFGNQQINKKFNWHNEVQYRNFNFAGDLEQLLIRTAIGYNLTENNNNVQLGYAFIHSQPYTSGTDKKTFLNEHRIYQQFITRQNIGRAYIQHRYRIEERFSKDNFRMRGRYFLSLNLPINNKTIIKNTVYASLYNEIFLNMEKPVFDRNRVYAGMGYAINNYLRLETGLMYQLLENSQRPQWQVIFSTIYLLKNSW